jgi:hypothetical protein
MKRLMTFISTVTAGLLGVGSAQADGTAMQYLFQDGGGVTPGIEASFSWPGEDALLVTGDFYDTWSPESDLLVYDRATQEGEMYTYIDLSPYLEGFFAAGEPERIGDARWDQVIAGNFGSYWSDDLFFFDSATGNGRFFFPEHGGNLVPSEDEEFIRGQRCDILLAADVHSYPLDDVLCYDKTSGELLVLATAPGASIIRTVSRNIGPGWDIIVSGKFGSSWWNTDLLLYDRDHGVGEFHSVDRDVNIERFRRIEGWRRTWHTIISATLGGPSTHTDLIFYDASRGEVQFYGTNWNAAMRLIGSTVRNLPRNAAKVVAGKFNDDGLTDLLFYEE